MSARIVRHSGSVAGRFCDSAQLVELAVDVAARLAGGARDLGLEQVEHVAEPFEHRGVDERPDSISSVRPGTEGEEIPREIAAVDRRDVGGSSGASVRVSLPVVEMTAIALHPQQRVEGRFETVDDAGDAEIAEVVGAERRQKLQPDVGGRRAMRDDVAAVPG